MVPAEVHGPLVRPPVFKTGVGRESVLGRFDSCAFPFLSGSVRLCSGSFACMRPSSTDLDAARIPSYDQSMSEARATTQPRPSNDEAERRRIVAKVERSLARLDAGEGVPHADVLAMIDERYPEPKK